MKEFVQINYNNIEENNEYDEIIRNVLKRCFEEEGLDKINIYINVILTNPEEIRKINNEFRKIDKETDVLSFPMFEKEELNQLLETKNKDVDILGDVIISIPKVYEQAEEYNHGFEREFAYMLVHGFYHLMGYDHMQEDEKQAMREKEENILQKLNITR